MATINHRAGALSAPVASFSHTYDVRGNLKALAELSTSKTYTYDQLERLTAVARQQAAGAATPAESYSYDGEGNRTASQSKAGPQQTYVTDGRNRILDDGVNTYTWGANNALTSRTPKAGGPALTFQNTWMGSFNQVRLDRVLYGGQQFNNFLYDGMSRPIHIQHADPARDFAWNYFDGDDMVLEWRRVNIRGAPQWARYVHGPNADQPLAMELYAVGAPPTPGTGQVFYYHADAEGSVRLVTDANAQIVNRYEYDSYGKRLSVVEGVSQPYTWKGREFIAGLDMYYNRARFYDPQMGRFTSEDPLGFDGGDSNVFAFGWNNPKRWNDPYGLASSNENKTILGISAAAATAIAVTGIRISCIFGYIGEIVSAAGLTDLTSIAAEQAICLATGRLPGLGGDGGKGGLGGANGSGGGCGKNVTPHPSTTTTQAPACTARASRRLAIALRPLRRPVSTMEQRSA